MAEDFRGSLPLNFTAGSNGLKPGKNPCVSAFQELRNHLSVHVGQAEVAALKFKGEFGVIDSQAMQKSGMKVMNMHGVFGHVV
jgi:hypothetical protein